MFERQLMVDLWEALRDTLCSTPAETDRIYFASMEGGKSGQEPAKPAKERPTPSAKGADRRKLLRGGVIAIAVVVALIAWLATRGDDSGSSEPATPEAEAAAPRIVTVDELRKAAAALGQPIYWAGPVAGKELVLKELGEGGVQVLYLPEGTEAGEGSAKSLTVGSYPLPDPEKALEGFAKRKGSTARQASDGREVVASAESPTSVYFTSPDNSVQVEVYDPSAQRAMSLALSGKVQPAG
jgi:hypothetical protein